MPVHATLAGESENLNVMVGVDGVSAAGISFNDLEVFYLTPAIVVALGDFDGDLDVTATTS